MYSILPLLQVTLIHTIGLKDQVTFGNRPSKVNSWAQTEQKASFRVDGEVGGRFTHHFKLK